MPLLSICCKTATCVTIITHTFLTATTILCRNSSGARSKRRFHPHIHECCGRFYPSAYQNQQLDWFQLWLVHISIFLGHARFSAQQSLKILESFECCALNLIHRQTWSRSCSVICIFVSNNFNPYLFCYIKQEITNTNELCPLHISYAYSKYGVVPLLVINEAMKNFITYE